MKLCKDCNLALEVRRETKMNKCEHCGSDKIVIVPANEPYSPEHLQCEECDSTYNILSNKYEERKRKIIENVTSESMHRFDLDDEQKEAMESIIKDVYTYGHIDGVSFALEGVTNALEEKEDEKA